MKKILEKLKKPHPLFLVLFYVVFAATLTGTLLLLVFKPEQGIGHYVLYALSAAELAYFVYTVIYLAPKVKSKIIALLRRHRFTENLLDSYGFRTVAFAAVGFTVNVAYAAFLIVLSILSLSVWNAVIAAFYIALILIKSIILFYGRKAKDDFARQNRTYLICGCMLNILPFALSGIIVMLFETDMTFEYAGIMIYAAAAYTFYRIISSVIQYFKAKRQDDMIVRAIRNVNTVSALYSVLVLKVAMFQAFGDTPKHFSIAITGGVIAAMIFAISIGMIVVYRANRFRQPKAEQTEKEEK